LRTRQALRFSTGEGVCASWFLGCWISFWSCSCTTHRSVASPGDTLKALKRLIMF
jgi:hypothetical protein